MKNRMWNFFREDGRALILAVDHSLDGRKSFNDPEKIFRAASAAGADGVLSTYGIIKRFRPAMGHMGVIMRMDQSGTYLNPGICVPEARYSVEDAIRLGADGIMSNVSVGFCKDGVNFDTASMKMLSQVASQCDKWNLALCAETLPMGSLLADDFSLEQLKIACRAVAEAGADFIKTVYKPVPEFNQVTSNTFIPVLALGGSYLKSPRDVFQHIQNSLDAGCKGMVIGRNVWSTDDVYGFTRAMVAMVHEGASIEDALRIIEE